MNDERHHIKWKGLLSFIALRMFSFIKGRRKDDEGKAEEWTWVAAEAAKKCGSGERRALSPEFTEECFFPTGAASASITIHLFCVSVHKILWRMF